MREMARCSESGEELAFFWSLGARRGAFSRACAPRGERRLSRSAIVLTDRFLKTAIQSSIDSTNSEYSSCQHG